MGTYKEATGTMETSAAASKENVSRKLGNVGGDHQQFSAIGKDVAPHTVLSQLVGDHKFEAAIQRAEHHPEEVEIWIEAPTTGQVDHHHRHYPNGRRRPRRRGSWPKNIDDDDDGHDPSLDHRQLPIHQACALLAWDHKDKMALEDLIVTLTSLCPAACGERDTDGILPLHRILPSRPSIELVVQMIASYPDALDDEMAPHDEMIWSSPEVDDGYSSQILELMQKGKSVLRQSRHEAGLRFLLGVQGLGLKDFTRGEATNNALLRSAYLRLAFPNMEVAATDSQPSADSGNTAIDAVRHGKDLQTLEGLLRDLLSKNEAYTDVLLNLSQERMSHRSHDVVHEAYALHDEIGDLRKHIRDLEMILRDHGIDKDGNEYFSNSDNGEMMSVMGMDPERPSALTKYMETKVTELQDEYEQMEDENERLIGRVEELQSMLNNLERKHVENSLHSSSDIESVRSKVLSMHDADSPGDVCLHALSIHETPASTPDASRDGEDESIDNELSDFIEKNKCLEEQNVSLLKEVEELREMLNKKTVETASSTPQSPSREVKTLRRQLVKVAETAARREESLRQQADNFEKELIETRKDNLILKEYQEELIKSLREASTFPQQESVDEISKEEESHGTRNASKDVSLADKLKVVDQLSGHQSNDEMDDDNVSCSTPSSSPSIEVSLAHSSAVNSQSILGSEMIASKGSVSITRSFGHSSSSRTGSNGSATSWTVLSLSQQPAKRKGRRQKSVKQLVDILPEGGNMMETFHDSFNDLAETFFKNDLNAIFKTAAEFYYDFGASEIVEFEERDVDVRGEIGLPRKNDAAKSLSKRKKSKRRFSDGGASPLVQLRKAVDSKVHSSDTLQQTALILAAEEDLSEIVRRSQDLLGCELPVALIAALEESTFQMVSKSNLGLKKHVVPKTVLNLSLVKRAEGILGHKIPESIMIALRSSSQALLDSSEDEELGMQQMTRRLEQEFLDTLVDTSEAILGRPLPIDLVDSLRTAAASSGNLLHETVDESNNQYSIRIDFQLLDMLFKKAQRMYGRKFSKQMIDALREASFVLQSRLEGTDFVQSSDAPSAGDQRDATKPTKNVVQSMYRSEPALVSSRRSGHRSLSARSDSVDQNDMGTEKNDDFSYLDSVQDVTGKLPVDSNGNRHNAKKGKMKKVKQRENLQARSEETIEWRRYVEEEYDDIKSTTYNSSERSLDVAGVFGESSSSGVKHRIPRSPRRKSKSPTSDKHGSGASLSVDGLEKSAYVRGRSPMRKNFFHGSASKLEINSSGTPKQDPRRPRSADSRFDRKASERFGTDDLDVIFKRAAKEVDVSTGSSNMYSRGMSSSSEGSIWSSIQKNSTFNTVDEVLDSLLSDTEETYGIEISDGVVWALKSAIQQAVDDPELLPVIRALHNDDIIRQASVFNEGEIPSDLVEAIRSASLPPGVSVESLAIEPPTKESTASNVTKPFIGRQKPVVSESKPIKPSEQLRDAMKTLEGETMHSETSWGILSNHVNNTGNQSIAADEVSSIGLLSVSHIALNSDHTNEKRRGKRAEDTPSANSEPSNVVISHREKKRQAEKRLSRGVAGFSGNSNDLQDLFTHAKETLDMYSPATSRKRHNPGKDGDGVAPSTPDPKRKDGSRKTDDLGEMFKAAYAESPRVDPSLTSLAAISPPAPPNFTAMAEQHARCRSLGSFDESRGSQLSGDSAGVAATFSDSLANMALEGNDDLKKLYENAYNEVQRLSDREVRDSHPAVSDKSPPIPKFESRALSIGDLKSPPLERRTPILARFLELNRQELLERTQSGREIPMISPVTEPTMDTVSIKEDPKARLLALAKAMPDLEDDRMGDSKQPEKKPSLEVDQLVCKDAEQLSGSNSRMEEASFDTFQELEAIMSETKKEFGTELSMELVTAIKKVTNSEMDPDSLHDSVSLLMEHIGMDSDVASTDESSLHGIAIELGKRLSSSAHSEKSKSLTELINSLRSKLAESHQKEKEPEPTARASKHYLANLVDTAQAELGYDLPVGIRDEIRCSSVEASTQRDPLVKWEDLEALLHDVCEGQDENSWFEIQEAFFRAWEKSKTTPVPRKTSKWGHSSGYFSAVSESEASISVLMDEHDGIDHLDDIVEEVRRIHGGEVPREVIDRLKDRLKCSLSDLEYSKDFGESSKSSGFYKGSVQSFNFDYSQSTFSSVGSPLTSPLLPKKASVHSAPGDLDGLDLIEEVRSQSSSSKNKKDVEGEPSSRDKQKVASSLKRLGSKSNSTVSSLSTSGDTQGSEDEYSVDLKSSDDRSSERNSSDSAPTDGTDHPLSAPTSVVMPPGRSPIERTHSAQSIQSAHSVTVNKTLGPDLLRELEKRYTGSIPEELAVVLMHSVTIPYSMNSDEDLSIIFQDYEDVCQKALPADLVLVLREASVSLRNVSSHSRSRRRLIRQSSGSFRSTSRSSGMPSISETGDNLPVIRKISQPEIVPGEIKTDHPTRTVPMLKRTASRRDSSDPGLPNFEPGSEASGVGSMDRSSHYSVNSEESMSLESVQHDLVVHEKHEQSKVSPGTMFNQSEATQLVSNVQIHVRAGDMQLDLGTLHSTSTSMDSTIEEFAEMDTSGHTGFQHSSRVLKMDKSDSISTLGTGGHSSHEHGDVSGSTSNITSVSRTSTLPSRRLPIGVDVSPPLDGVESDDLGVIFAAAAKRMSRESKNETIARGN